MLTFLVFKLFCGFHEIHFRDLRKFRDFLKISHAFSGNHGLSYANGANFLSPVLKELGIFLILQMWFVPFSVFLPIKKIPKSQKIGRFLPRLPHVELRQLTL